MTLAKQIRIYLLAGVATSPTIFTECRTKLEYLFRKDGMEPLIDTIFPYGDATRALVRQVIEVGSDMPKRFKLGKVGGKQALRRIKESYGGEPLLLIGHSGGGAAAYQAAKMLYDQGVTDNFRVVQIGSPRMPIDPRLKNRVSYFHAVDENGRPNDPITRIGSWGGFTKARRFGVPRWNGMKYAPGYVEGIRTVGGHADYFRHLDPFVDNQLICNLDKTISRVQEWLKQATYA